MPAKLPDDQGKRCEIGFRTTRETRAAIEDAACRSGRSISQEVEFRLEQTFAEDRMRAIAREEMDKREAENRAASFDRTMKILEAQGHLGPASNPVCLPSQRPRIYNEC